MSASGLKVEAKDGEITRYRPMVIIAEDNMTGSTGYQRAMWELKRNKAESQREVVTVQGWEKPGGGLWLPNELVRLIAPQLGLDGIQRLIVAVNFTLDNQNGTRTVLTLMHRDAFDEPADSAVNGQKKNKKATKSKRDNVKEFTNDGKWE